ncbi:hypothetical protein [Kordiimonas laminariae]|uniref:hypothetical protein n=1 Tax=Kordiimonas laminariae TaxID=2917717 RepID=UPI001FF556B9|nr:hypothetical protein [Kordiimonas laminariae]MCK0068932.1 hypothetical protein [Kordiimonas laminariae]
MGAVEFSLFLVKNSLISEADDRFKTIMRWSDTDLFRRPLSFLFPADASDRLGKLLEKDSSTLSDVLFPRVPLRVKTGGYINFDMKMEQTGPEERRLDFYKPSNIKHTDEPKQPAADMHSFFNFVEELLASPYEGDMELTMVSVDALKDTSKLTQTDKKAAREQIEQELQTKAIGGKVGKLDEASYGLITSGDWSETAFHKEMLTVAEKLNLPPDTFVPKTSNIELDDRDIPADKLHKALNHSRSVFLGEIEPSEASEKLSGVVDGIEHNRNLILNALNRYKYQLTPRDMMDTNASSMVGLLQQGKVNLEGQIRLPEEILVMADHPDISLQHDLAQLEDLIRMRSKKLENDKRTPEFYELCRSTLIQERFHLELAFIMEKYEEPTNSIGFRVKGIPPVKMGGPHWDALRHLRNLGHPIWIDRFSDAVMAQDALGCLRYGFVEVPTALIRRLSDHPEGNDLLTQLVNTWSSLQVGVVSADIEDQLKPTARDLGIRIMVTD